MSYGGLFLDLFIVPLLIFKRTRILALAMVLFFHLTNKVLFDIGVFPILSIALTLMFFEASWPRKYLEAWFPKHSPKSSGNSPFEELAPKPRGGKGDVRSMQEKSPISPIKPLSNFAVGFIVFYCFLQLLIPLRHHLYPNNVAWTEQRHRFSWRMMLRHKTAIAHFKGTDTTTGKTWTIHPNNYLSQKQERKMKVHPDMILQFAHFLEKEYQKNGMDSVVISANIQLSLNGRQKRPFVKADKNLAKIPYNPHKTIDWLEEFQPEVKALRKSLQKN